MLLRNQTKKRKQQKNNEMSKASKYVLKNKNPINEYRIGDIVLLVKNPFTGEVDINNIIKILKALPLAILKTTNTISVGDFSFLKKRQVDALYYDNMIYITNEQENEMDFCKNLIHELAHGCEEVYYSDIYEDASIKEEFLAKRLKMYEVLKAYGYDELQKEHFLNPEYEENFDLYLYKTIGYDKLRTLVGGFFVSPYAATSLREYFANGFENYFLKSPEEVSKISPALFNKISLFSEKPV